MIDIRLTSAELELLVSTLYARLDVMRHSERRFPTEPERKEYTLAYLLTALETNLRPPTNSIKNQP